MRLRSARRASWIALFAGVAAGPLASRADDPSLAPGEAVDRVRARLAMLEGGSDPALVHARTALDVCLAGVVGDRDREGACAIAAAAVDLAEARSRLARARAAVSRFGARTPSRAGSPAASTSGAVEVAPAHSAPALDPGDRETVERLRELASLSEREASELEASLVPAPVRSVGEPSRVLAAHLAEATASETFEEATVDENRRYARVERERDATRRSAKNAILASIPGRLADLRRLGVDDAVLTAFAERAAAARHEADLARSLLALEDLADDLGALERRVHEGAPR